MKVIIHKETGEYGHYLGNGEFAFSSHPYIFPDSMTLEAFKCYVKEQEGSELITKNIEVKNVEIIIFD
jgi:hypothetical protein